MLKINSLFLKYKSPGQATGPDGGVGFKNRISDPAVKAHMVIFARTKSSLMGRIQVTRVKSIAERSAELQNLYLRTCNSDAMIGQVKDRPKQQDTPDQPNKQ